MGRFLSDDSGAVATDWVILAASVVGIGVSSATLVRSGSLSIADDIQTALGQASVAAICQGSYAMQVLIGDREDQARTVADQIGQMTDEEILASYAETAVKVQSLRDNGEDPAYVNEILDYAALFNAEMESRRLDPPRDSPRLNDLAGVQGACGSSTASPSASHQMVYYSDPRLEEDRRAYTEEFARLEREQLGDYIVKIDSSFHEAVANGNRDEAAKLLDLSYMIYEAALANGGDDQIDDARARYERALQTWQEARL